MICFRIWFSRQGCKPYISLGKLEMLTLDGEETLCLFINVDCQNLSVQHQEPATSTTGTSEGDWLMYGSPGHSLDEKSPICLINVMATTDICSLNGFVPLPVLGQQGDVWWATAALLEIGRAEGKNCHLYRGDVTQWGGPSTAQIWTSTRCLSCFPF